MKQVDGLVAKLNRQDSLRKLTRNELSTEISKCDKCTREKEQAEDSC